MKEHFKSAAITFITAFALALYPQIDTLTTGGLEMSVYIGILATAARGGLKAVIQWIASTFR